MRIGTAMAFSQDTPAYESRYPYSDDGRLAEEKRDSVYGIS